jgi:hypothetical protein
MRNSRSAQALFVLVRRAPGGEGDVLCVHNVTSNRQTFQATPKDLEIAHTEAWNDLISGAIYQAEHGSLTLALEPYQVLWLEPAGG